jgi:hypothetical protein
MIPPLVRLPATTLDDGDLEGLAAVAGRLPGRTVLVGVQRDARGAELDEFVVAAALAARGARGIGVAARVDAGRAASVVAREATTAQLLGACAVLLLEGPPGACRDAAVVVSALFAPGVHAVTTPTASVVGARNLPLPDVPGGPPVAWREGDGLYSLVDREPRRVGAATVAPPGALPDAALVVLAHPLGPPALLVGALGP